MADRDYVIVTSIGTDRPGIVAELSGWILEHGGNIEDSRMSLLGGEFATLVLVSGEAGFAEALQKSCSSFEQQHNLTIFTKRVSSKPAAPAASHVRYILKATSLDHPGIVHQVSELLRQRSVNIVSAETHTTPAPFTAAPVFQFEMTIDVPGTMTGEQLSDELRELGSRDNIEFTLSADHQEL
jgi:glycine cleavage system transcriptional repressor